VGVRLPLSALYFVESCRLRWI